MSSVADAVLSLKWDVIKVVIPAEFAQYGRSMQRKRNAYEENPRRLLEVGLSVVLELWVTQWTSCLPVCTSYARRPRLPPPSGIVFGLYHDWSDVTSLRRRVLIGKTRIHTIVVGIQLSVESLKSGRSETLTPFGIRP
jgi:hypothetical protein